MNLTLHPDIQRFIDDQVRSGDFPTPEAVIEAAILEWRDGNAEALDEETIAAINEAEAQIDRGEGIDLDTLRTHMKNYLRRD
jgi:Arc/MetJ-type ribon-helix-helix transcriptional regulator